ncbi:hypothetical protein BBJ28_00009256 [Nothophytophthora sp. Chile5]|nr:hypothetical protein BBJ28_00009256 [Nothophytophthora sp. Chile5]
MELDPSIALWRGRGADAALLGVATATGKDGSKLVLVTTADEVREFCSQTRKCLNHWSFRAGGPQALRIGAVRHPQSRALFGVCGAPGVGASKKARQARRQEASKGAAALPANEGLAVWRDADLEVAKWRRAPLRAAAKAFALLVHPQLAEEAVVVFGDGSFAAFDEDLAQVLHSDDAKDASEVNDDEEDEEDEEEEVVWASLDSDHRNPLKGGLFLSLVLQKTAKQGGKRHELMVYQLQVPAKERSKGGALGAVLLTRRYVALPANEELSSCAFHAETFAYSFVGRSGSWQTLRFARDALTNSLTLVASQQLPRLASTEADAAMPLHKKRKLQAANPASGFTTCGVGSFSYLIVAAQDTPTKLTGWDAKFAVPVASVEINTEATEPGDAEPVVGRGKASSVGKLLRLESALNGEVVVAAYERGVFLVQVKNKHSTLASVLGASALLSSSTSVEASPPALPNSSVQWEAVTTTSSDSGDKLDAAAWEARVCSDDERERQLIADLSDPLVTSTTTEFTRRLDEALKKMKKKRKARSEGEEELSFRLLQAVTRRCVTSPALALWTPLETMLRTKRVSARVEPALLPTLMEHDQFGLLESALVNLTDVDERSIVRMLKFFIRKSDDPAFVKYVGQQTKAKSVDGSAACERFTVALLGLPTNGVFLHHAIRELELEEVLLLLAICKKLLLVLTAGDDSAEDKKAQKKTKKAEKASSLTLIQAETRFTPLPSASQCCTWICALLDAHLAPLVQRASQDSGVKKALRQLEALVQLQLRASAQYETVQGVLSNFLSGVQLPQAPGLPDYSIEELCM